MESFRISEGARKEIIAVGTDTWGGMLKWLEKDFMVGWDFSCKGEGGDGALTTYTKYTKQEKFDSKQRKSLLGHDELSARNEGKRRRQQLKERGGWIFRSRVRAYEWRRGRETRGTQLWKI